MSNLSARSTADSGISISEDYDQENCESTVSISASIAEPFSTISNENIAQNLRDTPEADLEAVRIKDWNFCTNENNVREKAKMFDEIVKVLGESLHPAFSTTFADKSGKDNPPKFDESIIEIELIEPSQNEPPQNEPSNSCNPPKFDESIIEIELIEPPQNEPPQNEPSNSSAAPTTYYAANSDSDDDILNEPIDGDSELAQSIP
jgi:hypothetical protein